MDAVIHQVLWPQNPSTLILATVDLVREEGNYQKSCLFFGCHCPARRLALIYLGKTST